jgi:hypothetical protein
MAEEADFAAKRIGLLDEAANKFAGRHVDSGEVQNFVGDLLRSQVSAFLSCGLLMIDLEPSQGLLQIDGP